MGGAVFFDTRRGDTSLRSSIVFDDKPDFRQLALLLTRV